MDRDDLYDVWRDTQQDDGIRRVGELKVEIIKTHTWVRRLEAVLVGIDCVCTCSATRWPAAESVLCEIRRGRGSPHRHR